MKTIFELMTTLSAEADTREGARVAIESGLAGAKDIYLAWGKEKGLQLKTLNETWREVRNPSSQPSVQVPMALQRNTMSGWQLHPAQSRRLVTSS